MEPVNLDQRLEKLERLPTGFFPSPKPEPASITSESNKHHKKRVVVVAYDHSNHSDAMIAKCISNGTLRATDDIRIVHVVNQSDYRALFAPMLSGTGTSGGIREELLDTTLASAADTFISEIITVLRKKGFEHVSSEVMTGDPKLAIIDYCRLAKPIYLLTGTRGLGAVKRTVMGSVSNYLIRHCPCPVLIVKLDPSEIEARKELNEKKAANFSEVLGKPIDVNIVKGKEP